MKMHLRLVLSSLIILWGGAAHAGPPKPLRARYIVTVADDFVVEVYHNGRAIPHARRQLLCEKFGATAEKIEVEVHAGDWLVFNVVNNQMRWNGAYYFAAAGCLDKDHFGFVSTLDGGEWSACDTFGDVDKFITEKTYFQHRPAQSVNQVWKDGDGLMKKYSGESWAGSPVWGNARNTWVKVAVR
ncbi:MAG: hypothetical protein JWO94_2205 [Verrucomicrobiaceae bacterium]|nr:hypothetical protein [Verrucomicrobiaceae bacterium]